MCSVNTKAEALLAPFVLAELGSKAAVLCEFCWSLWLLWWAHFEEDGLCGVLGRAGMFKAHGVNARTAQMQLQLTDLEQAVLICVGMQDVTL